MKKKMIMILAAALMTMSASSAFASFTDMELIRVVYERNTGTTEQLTDMGAVSTFLTGTHTVAGDALTASTPANLFVSYFAVNKLTGELYVSGSTTSAPVAVGTAGFNTLKNGVGSVYTYYNLQTADAYGVVTGLQSGLQSFNTKLDASQGSLGNAINIATRVNTEASLASLVNGTASSVSQTLYHFTNANTGGSVGQLALSISTNADGSTTTSVPAANTPIPAAAYLLGSGLMGLVGLRRKKKA